MNRNLYLSINKFETLDALRFFAFLRVFLLHIPDTDNAPLFNSLKDGGEIGVDFFFVLSGFLITFLLAKEKLASTTVNMKQFMFRRILRIWPLYYLGVLLAYANIFISNRYGFGSQAGYMPNIFYSVTFTENIKMIIEDNFPNGAPLRVFWSLCIEEQFYILWMLLFRFIKLKHMLKVLIALIITGVCFRLFAAPLLYGTIMNEVDLISKLDYFCIGGILAMGLVVYPDIMQKIKPRLTGAVQTILVCACLLFLFFHQLMPLQFLKKTVYFPTVSAFIFTVLIACFVIKPNGYQITQHSILSKWGNISYGMYVYHTPVILVLLTIYKKLLLQNNLLNTITFIVFAFAITLFVSTVSYKYFEMFFLRLRNKYFSRCIA